MKTSEMNSHQLRLYRMMDEATKDMIGGNENQMEDNQKGTEEYETAKNFLKQGKTELRDYFYQMIMRRVEKDAQTELKFAGSDFLKKIIDNRLTKWGY